MKNMQIPQLEGIGFVTNATGEQIGVLIDLRQHGELWEDFYDTLVAQARTDERRESLEEVRGRLERDCKRRPAAKAAGYKVQSLPSEAPLPVESPRRGTLQR